MDTLTGLGELAARYTILEELGRGGMAVVYRARDREQGRDVAIKVVHSRFRGDHEASARMAREAETIAALRHPGIVELYSVERPSDGSVALVMEYVPGETLKAVVTRQGPMAVDRVLAILRQVGAALAYAHQHGFVHRDVKPENIFLDDLRGNALLSDFGVARAMENDEGLTLTGASIGTPTYMSPEQIGGERVDGRSDLYSLALVGWEMLTGRRPWDGESLYEVIYRQKNTDLPALDVYRTDVPERVQYALEVAMAKDRELRWQSADELLAELDPDAPATERFERWRWEREMARIATPGVGLRGSWPADESSPTIRFRRGNVAPYEDRLFAPPPFRAPAPPPPPREDWSAVPLEPAGGGRRRALSLAALALGVVVALVLLATRRERGSRFAGDSDSDSALGLPAHVLAALDEGREGTAAAAPASATRVQAPVAQPVDTARTRTDGGALDTRRASSTSPASRAVTAPAAVASASREEPPALPSRGAAAPPLARDSASDAPVRATRSEPSVPAAGPGIDFPSEHGSVAAGGSHSCALGAGGAAACWGSNEYGQLGDGTQTSRLVAVPVAGEFRFRSITSGIAHSCGLGTDGSGYCWGSNEAGQLGDGTRASRSAPVRIAAKESLELIRAGRSHSCAIAMSGRVLCWGANAAGELGDGTNASRVTPVTAQVEGRFRKLATGWSHSCALRADGVAFCWGANKDGQLGDGTRSARVTPVQARTTARFVGIAAGAAHSCAIDEAGVAYCWGDNSHGQLGTGKGDAREPVKVATSVRFTRISAGSVHTCALARSGETYCWGRNTYGQLGDGTTADRATPVKVTGGLSFVSVDAVGAHSCAATSGGARYCWGYNAEAQLGDSSRAHRSSPVRVSAPSGS